MIKVDKKNQFCCFFFTVHVWGEMKGIVKQTLRKGCFDRLAKETPTSATAGI